MSRRGLGPALSLGAGVIVTIEFSAAALLPDLAADLGVSLARAGWLVSIFALGACLGGPPLTAWAAGRDSRAVMTGILVLFALGNLLAAASGEFALLLAIRLLQGASLPVFLSLAIRALAATRTAATRGAALAVINAGVVAGAVVVLPASVALAGAVDWRAAFAVLGGLCLVAVAAVRRAMADQVGARTAAEPAARTLSDPQVLKHLALSVVVFAAMFCSYTYLTAVLFAAALSPAATALALAGFALAGLAGNAAAGPLSDRGPLRATIAAMGLFAATMAFIALTGGGKLGVLMALGPWGALHAANFVIGQARILGAAAEAPAVASALNIAASNLGIALGAVIGGGLSDRGSLAGLLWASAALSLAAAALAAVLAQSGAWTQSGARQATR